MLNAAGEVTEATTANVYAIRDGRLCTRRRSRPGILEGTTRTRILALCAEHGIWRPRRSIVAATTCDAADEVFVSSSVRGILPVVDPERARRSGTGAPGPLTRRIRDWFEAAADREAETGSAAARMRAGSLRGCTAWSREVRVDGRSVPCGRTPRRARTA